MKKTLTLISLIALFSANSLWARELPSPFDPRPFVNPLSPGTADLSGWYSGEKKYAGTRKNILRAHQVAGMTTWLLWLATNLEGEKAYKKLKPDMELPALLFYSQNPATNLPLALAMKYDNPALLLMNGGQNNISGQLPLYYLVRENSEWKAEGGSPHKSLGMATAGMYAVTASLALLAPSRFKEAESEGFDSIFFHKGLAVLHLAAMLALPSLGEKIEHQGPAAAQGMRSVGWAGFSALTLAFGVVYF
jgi:hypothetical protein